MINEKLSRDKWETCKVARDWLSRTLFPKKTTMAATVGKYFRNGVGDTEVTSRNLQTCIVIWKSDTDSHLWKRLVRFRNIKVYCTDSPSYVS